MTRDGSPERNGRRALLNALRLSAERRKRHRQDGEAPFASYLGQVGVLGWMIVIPALAGAFFGRWLDRHLGTGVFWTLPLIILGLALGCWSAWRWMHR